MTREEAIDRVRQLYLDANDENKAALGALIPDLKDSEDERIRKEIRTLYNEIDSCIDELLKARTDKDTEAEGKALFKMEGLMVATLQDLSCIEDYLEKRKENPKSTDSIYSNCVSDAIWASRILTNAIVILADSVDYKRSEPLIYSKEIEDLKRLRGEIEKQKEQKPELPLMKGDAVLYFDEWRQHYQGSPTKRKCFEEGMRYAQRLQKPAEWSEEDERNYNYLHQVMCCYINNPQIEYKEREKASKKLIPFWERLKSLRPSWKPSEEQMKALGKAISRIHSDDEIPILCELIQQLEQLM